MTQEINVIIKQGKSGVSCKKGLLLISLMFLCNICLGDEIVLGTGKHLTGEIVSLEDNDITVKTATDEVLVNVRMVSDITTDSKDSAKTELVEKIRQKLSEHKKPARAGKTTKSDQAGSNKAGVAIFKAGEAQ